MVEVEVHKGEEKEKKRRQKKPSVPKLDFFTRWRWR